EAAKQGQIPDCSFTVGQSFIDQVEKEWGKADRSSAAGKDMYFIYSGRYTMVGVNKENQIIDLRSNGPELQQLTESDVTKVLGEPHLTQTLYV
ncbi:YjgB family protein, partial [Neobacillus drentensis]|uniref:YjgB family protein n=1 Tax=Neobacillus drentensis TaxID=220684 RepID=UPI00300276A9